MKASFYGEARGNDGVVKVRVDNPLAPPVYWSIEEAREHIARLSLAIGDAEGIRRTLAPRVSS